MKVLCMAGVSAGQFSEGDIAAVVIRGVFAPASKEAFCTIGLSIRPLESSERMAGPVLDF